MSLAIAVLEARLIGCERIEIFARADSDGFHLFVELVARERIVVLDDDREICIGWRLLGRRLHDADAADF